MAATAGSSASGTPGGPSEDTWLTLSSTVGMGKVGMPDLSRYDDNEEDFDLGFKLPTPPSDATEAIEIMRKLLRKNGLPQRADYAEKYNGLRQQRLVHAVLKLMLQCLDRWASDETNAGVAWTTSNGFRKQLIRRHQLCPLSIHFLDGQQRSNSFKDWYNHLTRDERLTKKVEECLNREKIAYGTIQDITFGHRVASANLYLVTTNDAIAFGNSFRARQLAKYDTEAHQAYMQDEEARDAHAGRGGSGHEVAVLISEHSKDVFIYDPSFDVEHWAGASKEDKRIKNVPFLMRARQLLEQLRGKHDPKMTKKGGAILIGGGGNFTDDCRAMSMRWVALVVAGWMGVPGSDGELPYFGPNDSTIELFW